MSIKIKNLSWFEKYRAQNLDEYVFPTKEIENFAKQVYEDNFLPGNVIFYGKPGTGKSNLAQILIKHIIKNKSDLYIIRERSVKEIDEIKIWIQKPPISSKQKIVFAEEADRLLQSKQAIAELKTITERYLPNTVFFFITNYISKFSAADNALLTRFTYRFEFNTLPKQETVRKLCYILDSENISYQISDVESFVEAHQDLGLRDLINKIQILSLNGSFDYNNISFVTTNKEDEIIELIIEFIKQLLNLPNSEIRILLDTTNIYNVRSISNIFTNLLIKLQDDTLLDYSYILMNVLKHIDFVPFYKITLDYLENLDYKKYKNLHLISLLYEYIKILSEFG